MRTIRPVNDRVIIKRDEASEKVGSIVVPEMAKERPLEGEVVAAGPEAKMIHAGDHVLFGRYSGTEIKHDGVELVIMREDEVLAVVNLVDRTGA